MKYLISVILFVWVFSCKPGTKQEIETCEVSKGEFLIDLTEEGEIHATKAINISSPAMSWRFGLLKITQIVEDGQQVRAGDTVIVFDPSEVLKAIVDAESELEIARAELEKLKAQQESKIEELKANIEISDISHRILEIKLEQATFDADITRKEIGLNLDKAKISLDKAREEILNQEKIHHEEIQQSKLKIKQLEVNLADANKTLETLTVVSPSSGIAIIRRNWNTQNKWQVGDQPWSGSPLIDLPDLSELKVEADISEVDISKVQLAQAVEIKLDAFSDSNYSGTVVSIANLAQFKNRNTKIKIFPVDVLISGSSEKLLPGMTVSCRIIIDKIQDVLSIPLDALFLEDNNEYVYVKTGNSFQKKTVKTGRRNNDYIIIHEGIEEGQIIALSDPFKEVGVIGK
jgi:RND family efflux transporter MFP subunit